MFSYLDINDDLAHGRAAETLIQDNDRKKEIKVRKAVITFLDDLSAAVDDRVWARRARSPSLLVGGLIEEKLEVFQVFSWARKTLTCFHQSPCHTSEQACTGSSCSAGCRRNLKKRFCGGVCRSPPKFRPPANLRRFPPFTSSGFDPWVLFCSSATNRQIFQIKAWERHVSWVDPFPLPGSSPQREDVCRSHTNLHLLVCPCL